MIRFDLKQSLEPMVVRWFGDSLPSLDLRGSVCFSRDSVQALNRLERTYYSGTIAGLDALGLPAISDYDLMMSWMFGVVLQQDDFQKEDSLWLSPAGLMVKIIASDSLGVNHLEVYENSLNSRPSMDEYWRIRRRALGQRSHLD